MLLVAVFAAASPAFSQNTDASADPTQQWIDGQLDDTLDKAWRLTLYWENDSNLFIPNSPADRHYTNGTAFSLTFRPDFADDIAKVMPSLGGDFGGQPRTAFGFQLAQQIYTPEQIDNPTPNPDDRPYAGYLYVGGYWQRAGEQVFDQVQLDLGLVGPSSLAEEAQESVHSFFEDSLDPEGWDNQLRDEPTVQLTLRRKWRTPVEAGAFELAGLPLAGQVIPSVELGLGTVKRQVEVGVLGRVGYQLPDDFGPDRLSDIGSLTGDMASGWSWYLYGRLAGRVVQHDIFLDGSDFRDSPSVEHEPFVGEGELGFALAYRDGERWSLAMNYGQVYRTQEFKTQNDNHQFGRFSLAFTYNY